MDFTLALLGLAGAIALFLWGTHMAQTGVQRALGPRLRQILGQTLSNRTKAFFAGIGLTLLLQSSTATCLMAASFTANGMVDLLPAMAVMLATRAQWRRRLGAVAALLGASFLLDTGIVVAVTALRLTPAQAQPVYAGAQAMLPFLGVIAFSRGDMRSLWSTGRT